jgi:hypothetical protein
MLRIFQAEVAMQCRFLLLDWENLNTLSPERLMRSSDVTDAFWHPVQGILICAANASKLLWGDAVEVANQRRDLRRSLNVTRQSPFYTRKVRNEFEHFDEKVEKWFATSNHRNFVGRNVGSPQLSASAPQSDWFGHYDPSTSEVIVRGYSMTLAPLAEEADRIAPVALAGSQRVP